MANVNITTDGFDWSKYLVVTKVERPTYSISNELTDRQSGTGSYLKKTRKAKTTIKVDVTLLPSVKNNWMALEAIENLLKQHLTGKEFIRLIFSDRSDRYYLVKLDGNDGISLINKTVGQLSLNFINPSGVAYSNEEYVFTNSGKNYIAVNNPGMEPMLLSLEATFSSDNGFLGIQNDAATKALFGTVAEVDGYAYQTSDRLFDDHFIKSPGWILNDGVTPPVTAIRDQVGTIGYKEDPEALNQNEGFAYPTGYGSGSSWHGPSLTKIIPADKNGVYPKNWKTTWRFDFNTNGAVQSVKGKKVGHQSMTFVDANDKIICAIVVEDNQTAKEKSDLAFYIGDKRIWDTRNTDLFYTTQRPTQSYVSVEKIGSQITFSINYARLKKTFTTQAPNVELRKITWYSATYKTNEAMVNNLLRAINLVKHNVDNWKDIPNKFGDGDVLTYGREGDTNVYCLVNNLQGLQLRDPGSTLITAPPGFSTFYLTYSDFAEIPEVTLRGRAVYL